MEVQKKKWVTDSVRESEDENREYVAKKENQKLSSQ